MHFYNTKSTGPSLADLESQAKKHQEQSCCQKLFQYLKELLDSSPETLEQRNFIKEDLLQLTCGNYFKLLSAASMNKQHGFSGMLNSFMGGNPSTTSNKTINKSNETVLFRLSESDQGKSFDWSTLELLQNEPKDSGSIQLHDIKFVQEKQDMIFCLIGANNVTLLELEASSTTERDRWVVSIRNALKMFDIEEDNSSNRGLLYHQKRKVELAQRQREREEQKKKLGSVGMQYTAQAMVNRK